MLGGFPEDIRWIQYDGKHKFTRRCRFCPESSHFDKGEQVVLEL
jgi:hypothetical protein